MAEERPINAAWSYVADTVMGGVSTGTVAAMTHNGEAAHRLRGRVSLDNNGGFIQMTTDLGGIDAQGWTGLRLTLAGNGQAYDIRLRTSDLRRPWQSYRAERVVGKAWQVFDIPFTEFEGYRIDTPLDLAKLTRVGILAIGREFDADVAVAGIALYR
ncbi:MAG: CIA30 family protein [Pseudomonadota bacterium]